MNNNILISVSILQNLWKNGRRDSLDLLLPFLKCSIARTTLENNVINLDAITQDFREEYGYQDIPMNVIIVMLNRLSPSVVTRNKNEYTLKVSLEKEVNEFESRRQVKREHQEKVINALRHHLEENICTETFSDETVSAYLYSFFVSNGLCIARNTDGLIGLKRKDGRVEYEIARFIMDEFHKDSSIFSYINELVEGFFVSTALSIQQAATSTNTKMRNLSCYIDTRLLINALGLHLPLETKKCVIEFLEMLKNSGVRLYCFKHNYEEIRNVLTAYKMGLTHKSYNNKWSTLETFVLTPSRAGYR